MPQSVRLWGAYYNSSASNMLSPSSSSALDRVRRETRSQQLEWRHLSAQKNASLLSQYRRAEETAAFINQ